jgi:hypothetical protein
VVSVDRAQTLLVECPRLHLLLLLWQVYDDAAYKSAQIPHVYDVRFVIGLSPADYWGDWEDGAKGLPHLWSLGDDLVAGKRSKAIAGTALFSEQHSYYRFDPSDALLAIILYVASRVVFGISLGAYPSLLNE